MKNDEKRGVSKRTVAILLALVLVIGCAVGGTLAWLTAKTQEVKNTFTYGDINIELTEQNPALVDGAHNAKIIPGVDISKDPKVTVKANSEACWLFVKVDENENWPTFKVKDAQGNDTETRKVDYSVRTGSDGWTALGTEYPGVYYREVAATGNTPAEFYVLAGNTANPNGVVTVSDQLKKSEVNTVKSIQPTLTFTAYAVQKDGITSVTEAWAKAQVEANY